MDPHLDYAESVANHVRQAAGVAGCLCVYKPTPGSNERRFVLRVTPVKGKAVEIALPGPDTLHDVDAGDRARAILARLKGPPKKKAKKGKG